MLELSMIDLATVSGGATTKAAAPQPSILDQLHSSIESDYKSFICKAAGWKGANTLANTMFKGKETQDDIANSAAAITGVCMKSKQLPADAPQLPF